jgi:hypothetical protein
MIAMTALDLAPSPLPTRPALLRRLMADAPEFTTLGLILALATLTLFAAMTVDPRTFQGVDVWVKPAKFAISLSLYLLTLALFARWLPAGTTGRMTWRAYAWIVALAILAEMAWIGGAALFGVGSHFNIDTPLMSALYAAMGIAAVTLTSATLVMGVAIWRNPATGLPPALRLSVALGLVLTFVLTLIVAGTMAQTLSHHVGTPATGAMLPVMGWSREVGDLRVAHFFATHAMHALPLAGLLAARLPEATGRRLVWAAAAGFTALVAGTFLQALAGLPFLPWLG